MIRDAGQAPRYLSALEVKQSSPLVPDTLLSVSVKGDDVVETQPVVLSSALGRGRIVVLGSSTVLRNRALRECTNGFDILAVRALEFLSAGQGSMELRFDEYHQGYGSHAGSLPAILAEFAGTRSGRMFFQLAGAGVLLLLAFAPRALPPREALPPDRRSPLEHVDALARAYQQVGATRTATSRLVRGLRRRQWKHASLDRKMPSTMHWSSSLHAATCSSKVCPAPRRRCWCGRSPVHLACVSSACSSRRT